MINRFVKRAVTCYAATDQSRKRVINRFVGQYHPQWETPCETTTHRPLPVLAALRKSGEIRRRSFSRLEDHTIHRSRTGWDYATMENRLWWYAFLEVVQVILESYLEKQVELFRDYEAKARSRRVPTKYSSWSDRYRIQEDRRDTGTRVTVMWETESVQDRVGDGTVTTIPESADNRSIRTCTLCHEGRQILCPAIMEHGDR